MEKSGQLFQLISLNNPVFRSYVFWSSVLVTKMLGMTLLTAFTRYLNLTVANPEDLTMLKKLKVRFDCEPVERTRRAHLNDLENVLPFFLTGFIYCLTDPSEYLAINLFRVCAISRIIHTFCYAIVPLPQPSRVLSFAACFVATGFMALKSALYFF